MQHKPKHLYVVILAGGGGTRLWPVSRKKMPKQLLPFFGSQTLLEKTFSRLKQGFPISRIFISTNVHQFPIISKQLPKIPKENFIIEPAKKDTAPAIGLVAATLLARDPNAVFVTSNVDHYIKKEKEFIKGLAFAEQVVDDHPSHIALLGINPTYPETGYGYIKMGKRIMRLDRQEVFSVQRFTEKPDYKTAKEYIARWEYLWNPAMFVWRADTLLKLYKKHLPDMHKRLLLIQRAIGTTLYAKILRTQFLRMKPISIDYGIIEKTKSMFVLPVDIGWADIGHWRSVKDVLSESESDNVVKGRHIGIDTTGSLIYSYTKRLIASVGVKDLVVIDTDDVLLVCPKDRAQDVKKMVDELTRRRLKKYV